MSPSQLKLIALIVVVGLAFSAGWRVNGWRHEAKRTAELEQLTEDMQQLLTEQAEKTRLANERLRLRETELLQELDLARTDVAMLTEEIDNAEVVTITERIEVPANCPAVEQCARVDSVRFQDLYNRAATGALSDTGTGEQPVP